MQHGAVVLGLDQLDNDGSFHRARLTRPDGIVLHSPGDDYPLLGTWTSDTIKSDFDFTELLPSWNALVPDGTGVRFEVRVRDAADKNNWSPWTYIGYWGRVTNDNRVTEFDWGKVDVDTLMLKRPANAFEIRATLADFHPTQTATPSIRKIAAVYSRPTDDKILREMAADRAERRAATQPTTRPARVDIPVPFRAQGDNPDSVRHSTCSPTSVSMVLAWAGADRPILDNALAIWDDDNAMFGNWNRAVQFAGSLGFDATVERFNSMDDVRDRLAQNQPIIASIRFKRGEFPSNLEKETAGHLIVIRGYDEHGDLIVNDPASRAHGNGVVYKADELAHAWFVNAGGAAYVIKKKS